MRAFAWLLSLLLLLALVPASLPGSAEAQSLELRIEPAQAGNTAVRASHKILVSGTAPANATVTEIVARGHEEEGGFTDQLFGPHIRNRTEEQAGAADFLHIGSDGQIRGRLTLNCVFHHPDTFCLVDRGWVTDVQLLVTLSNGPSAESNLLRVDFTSPVITGYDVVQENRIRVWFSEPVRHSDSDNIRDWEVRDPDAQVLRIEGPTAGDCARTEWPEDWEPQTGCTRTLVITPIDEDAQPQVRHLLAAVGDYQDFANNTITRDPNWGGGAATSRAADRVRPALPSIDVVNGEPRLTTNEFDGQTRNPTLQISNVRMGHQVYVRWVGTEGTEGQTEPVAVTGLTATVSTGDLGPDDQFTLEAVAIDANGNESHEVAEKNGPLLRPDSGRQAITYVLVRLPTHLSRVIVDIPQREHYTREQHVRVGGGTDPPAPDQTIEVRDRLTGELRGSTTIEPDGWWELDVALDTLERRYRLDARLRIGEETGAWVPVPPIILDTRAPLVQALTPGVDPTRLTVPPSGLDLRPQYYEGDPVEISWLGTDPAPLDLENPDHGHRVDIDMVFTDAQTAVARDVPYSPITQRYVHTVRAEDVGSGPREAAFDITVHDRALNQTTATTLPILLGTDLLGYTPWFVDNSANQSVIEARFPAALAGSSSPADWRIDGVPPRSVSQPRQQGAETVVTLVATQSITDPNATPEVQFVPPLVNRLRAADGRDINPNVRNARDGIAPTLTITNPHPGPLSADTVTFSGRTDETNWPNRLRVIRDGVVIQTAEAGRDGRFTITVPLDPDRVNTIEVVAHDPSSNVSPARSFEVIEDSTPPVVVITRPRSERAIPRILPIEWETLDNNPDVVDIEYRVGAADWRPLVTGLPDRGFYRWAIPGSIPDAAVLGIRITATDRAGHRGQAAIARGLRLSLLAACVDVEPAPFADRDQAPEVHRWAIDCLYKLGIAKGSTRGGQLQFDPQRDISRGQFSGFLLRTLEYANMDLPGPGQRFDDVPAGHTFDADIHRLAAAEVILGYDERHFGPRDLIKRDQTASLLLRALGYARDEDLRPSSNGYFADTATSAHRTNIDAAYEQGLVVGRTAPSSGSPGTYDPGALTTRAQMATVLVRALAQFDG